jgi:pilus assembly protein CpaF
MSLRDRFAVATPPETRVHYISPRPSDARSAYRSLKHRVHQLLIAQTDLEKLEKFGRDKFLAEAKPVIERLLEEEHFVLNENERRTLLRDIEYEVLGHGPIEPLLNDPSISDILVNTHAKVFVERGGRLELTDVSFDDDTHMRRIIDKIVSRVGRRVDESSPMVDARLPDGSRVNAIIPPLAIDGPILSIRRFASAPLSMEEVIRRKSLTPEMATLLEGLARAKVNILISGGTGAGKTTLLNILSGYIGEHDRIVTIEDTAELQLQQPHVVRLETRPPNIEGHGEVTQRALLKNSLRMRPDRLVLGEVRGAEAFDLLNAMNSGHEGSMATIHANTPRDALVRVENMVCMAGMSLPQKSVRAQIAAGITVVIQIARLLDGQRKLMSIQEVTGMEGETIAMQEIFTFRQTGVDERGNVVGHCRACGVRPRFMDRLLAHGIELPDDLFDPARVYE